MNDDAIMSEAERELEASLMKISGEIEARMLPYAKVESIDSCDWCEDGKTFAITVELADGRLAMLQFCPGSQITCGILGDASAYRTDDEQQLQHS